MRLSCTFDFRMKSKHEFTKNSEQKLKYNRTLNNILLCDSHRCGEVIQMFLSWDFSLAVHKKVI